MVIRLAAFAPDWQNVVMSIPLPEVRSRFPLFATLTGFVVIAALLQLPLILNPGYYSHDELQWAALADVAPGARLPWVEWLNWQVFQFRPLTLNLWLELSHLFFKQPIAFHALWVALGIGNGLLLLRLMQRLKVADAPALLFALGFTLGPYAAYTHGWVATLADLLWVGSGLTIAHVMLWADDHPARHWPACAIAFVFTTLALLSKESAIVLPALLALAWLLSGRPRLLRDATIATALPVAVYLSLRLDIILFASRPTGAYQWSFLSIPKQWLMYQLYPLVPSVVEIHVLLLTTSTQHLLWAGALCLTLAILAFRANARAGLLLVIGGGMALGPVLLLEIPADHYGYGFAVVSMLALALAWAGLGRVGRSLAVLFVIVCVWHGINVQRDLRADGERQARFSPALAHAVATATHVPIRLHLSGHHDWVYLRATHEIVRYAGVPIGDRVQLVGADEAADYDIQPDGSLKKTLQGKL